MRLLLPLWLARLWWRARREPLYGHAWRERLGFGAVSTPGGIWLHAVSLGETRAAEPLVRALRAQWPALPLLLTHGTATGRAAGVALLGPADHQCWLPLDTPGAVRRFFQRHRPALGILMETEVWPQLLHAARDAAVPVVLANARLSEKSLRQSLRFDALLRPAAGALALALAQTDADAQRLRQAGVLPERVSVVGNLKFDQRPEPALLALGQSWTAGLSRPVVLAASWREGEDVPLVQAWRDWLECYVATGFEGALVGQGPPLLVIVPRHPQRFDAVADTVISAGLSLARRSDWGETGPGAVARQAQVWLGDSMGEMPAYYACAHAALLGGSYAPLGGQNLIEAAACGCPVFLGPHTFNFAQAADQAIVAGAAWRCADLEEAVGRACELVECPPARSEAAVAALAYGDQDQGIAQRMVRAIQPIICPSAAH
jgi:3-deoxy-D-manno-octulosonic-acid transferase